jgi:hypothetical protein
MVVYHGSCLEKLHHVSQLIITCLYPDVLTSLSQYTGLTHVSSLVSGLSSGMVVCFIHLHWIGIASFNGFNRVGSRLDKQKAILPQVTHHKIYWRNRLFCTAADDVGVLPTNTSGGFGESGVCTTTPSASHKSRKVARLALPRLQSPSLPLPNRKSSVPIPLVLHLH